MTASPKQQKIPTNTPPTLFCNGLTLVAAATTAASPAMAPKRARNIKGQYKPDPTPQKCLVIQVRKIPNTHDEFLTSSYHALVNVKSQQTQLLITLSSRKTPSGYSAIQGRFDTLEAHQTPGKYIRDLFRSRMRKAKGF